MDERYAKIIQRLEELELQREPSTPDICIEEAGDILPPTPKVRPPSFANLFRILDQVENLPISASSRNSNTGIKSSISTNSGTSTPLPIDSGYASGEDDPFEQAFSNASPPRIKQIFFDCDNTLVKTEDITVEAAADVVNKCLADHNVDIRYSTEQIVYEFFGMTASRMLKPLAKGIGFELTPAKLAEYAKHEEDLVIDLIHTKAKPCTGIKAVLEELHKSGEYKLAVVSSSPTRRIRAALEAADIAQYFDHDQVYSAKSSMPTPISKPNPAIYKWAMEKNNVYPWECVAVEDSRSGARSAIKADIACIAYVGAYITQAQRDQVAMTLRFEGCNEVMHSYSEFQGKFQAVTEHVLRTRLEVKGLKEPASDSSNMLEFLLWLAEKLKHDQRIQQLFSNFMQQAGWEERLMGVVEELHV